MAVEADQSRYGIVGLGTFVTLLAAHAMMLIGHPIAISPWSVFVYIWQDAAVALAVAILAALLRRPSWVFTVYFLVVAYAALNVVVARVLPSPLTPAMWAAASTTLSDSIAAYLTLPNALLLLATIAVAAIAPMLAKRFRVFSFGPAGAAAALLVIVLGLLGQSRLDTGGWHRNAFGALLPRRLLTERVAAAAVDWRSSLVGRVTAKDLEWLRGRAAGKHVVIVVLESVGAEYLSLYGADSDPMPNLSRLAERAVVFESAYAAYPESIKGLFATLCSRHPGIGVGVELHAAAACGSLPEALGEAGYRTGLFHSGRFSYLGMQAVVDALGFDTAADASDLGGRVDSSFGIDETTTVDAMFEWIDSLEAQDRFLLTYLPIAGHHPYAVTMPGPFEPRDDRQRYLNAIHEADLALGSLLAGLSERGLTDETLVVAFGDHGEAFGQHAGNIGHSFFLYEENVRIPYLIAGAGFVDAPVRARQTISVVDTAPTVLDLLGLPVPDGYEGVSALANDGQMALFVTDYAQRQLGLADGCNKAIVNLDTQSTRLFDICEDSAERIDRARAEPALSETYRRHLEAWAGDVRARLLQP